MKVKKSRFLKGKSKFLESEESTILGNKESTFLKSEESLMHKNQSDNQQRERKAFVIKLPLGEIKKSPTFINVNFITSHSRILRDLL